MNTSRSLQQNSYSRQKGLDWQLSRRRLRTCSAMNDGQKRLLARADGQFV
jgi:hypothetical protein